MGRMFFLFALVSLFSSTGTAQNSVTITSDPTQTARPVSALLEQVRKREELSVTYEDPRYLRDSDMDERPASFAYGPQEMRGPDAEATVARMLREYELGGGPTFTVVRDGIRLHVVPDEILNGAGQRVHQDSVLDAIISIPPRKRNGSQLLGEICNQVQKQTGYLIDVGIGTPTNFLVRYHTAEGIENQPARSALGHLLDSISTPGRYVWDLYYDPNDNSYGLNFSDVGHSGFVQK